MYQLVLEKGCKKINLATGPDLDKLKLKARKYNRKGYNVKIVKNTQPFKLLLSILHRILSIYHLKWHICLL